MSAISGCWTFPTQVPPDESFPSAETANGRLANLLNRTEGVNVGHFCRICQCVRANERFSGRGHRTHVCKACMQLPKAVRAVIEQEEEIARFLKQSRISEKNLKRLQTLTEAEEPRIAELAAVVIEVARVRPYKKRRLKVLARERRDLLDALERVGLIDEYQRWGDDEDWAGY